MPLRLPTALFKDTERPKRERLETRRRERKDPRFVITMVHGTWAKRATWIKPHSYFSQILRAKLAPARIVPFRWSGGNSVKARAEAIEKLRSRLLLLHDKYPGAHHAIVAHSHGGTVALSALADAKLATSTLGVVTLATPFLDAKVRERAPLLGPVDVLVAATFAGIAVVAVGAALGHGRGWWLQGLMTFAAIVVVLLAAALCGRSMREHARRVCERMPKTQLQPGQLSIIRTSADEAAAALFAARVAGGFASIFWQIVSGRVVAKIRDTLERVDYLGTRRYLAAVERSAHVVDDNPMPFPEETDRTNSDAVLKTVKESVLPYLPILAVAFLDDTRIAVRWIGVMLAVVYGLPAITALLISLLSVPFGVLFALGLLPCGWTLPLAGPYLDLTVEPTPPKTWSVTQLRAVEENGLSHGKSHDDLKVAEFVGVWLEQRAALAGAMRSSPADADNRNAADASGSIAPLVSGESEPT